MSIIQEEFCICDLWAAEAYLTALDAQETELLKLLDSGIKIHQWFLDKTTEQFKKEVVEAKYGYEGAKSSVHALNYGIGSDEMTIRWGLPHYVTEWQHHFYHKSFLGIKLRQEKIKEKLYNSRTLVSLLGRKRIFLAPMNEKTLHKAYAWASQSAIGELTILALTKLFYLGVLSKRLPNFPWMFPALNTHDGLAIRCYKGNRELVEKCIENAFRVPLQNKGITITIPIEVGWASNFSDIKDKKILRY